MCLSLFSTHNLLPHSPIAAISNVWSLSKVIDSQALPKDDSEKLSDIFDSPKVFRLNYAEMEKKFKIYIYPDADPNTFYQTPRKLIGKYASEGYFSQNIKENQVRTEDPDQADLFFIPISCQKMRGKEGLFQKKINSVVELRDGSSDYLGKGVSKAVANVNTVIGPALIGKTLSTWATSSIKEVAST